MEDFLPLNSHHVIFAIVVSVTLNAELKKSHIERAG